MYIIHSIVNNDQITLTVQCNIQFISTVCNLLAIGYVNTLHIVQCILYIYNAVKICTM